MLWRISAALAALYFVHGSENLARDSARLASEIRQEAPQAMVAACIDRPEICQQLLRHASGQASTPVSASVSAATAESPRRNDPAEVGIKAPPLPVVSGEFPLPPLRPSSLSPRKRA